MNRPTPGGTWISLGSSPDAVAHLEYARRKWRNARIITGNRGFQIANNPDVYMVFDKTACDYWRDDAYRLRREFGTWLITLFAGQETVRINRGVHDFNEFLTIRPNDWGMTGLWITYYAAKMMRADRIVLCGHQGYPAAGVGYFDGSPTPNQHHVKTIAVLGPRYHCLAVDSPDCEFVALGPLQWELDEGMPNMKQELPA